MGNLPAHRVSGNKPFEFVGVDYGGPFHLSLHKGRGCKTTKVYLCVFVCFSTKAVHLELASDLSTSAFLAAFRRFIARRGRCSHIYSDSGTNFIGAKRYFSELQRFSGSDEYTIYLATNLAQDGITWHLNPPAAPHFGGLWEAAIKSVKFHISRVIGQQILTYEEFSTVLCQIEAILNSRPLSPLSADPNDLGVLTPNHFLMQEPAVCLADDNYMAHQESLLTRWQLLQRMQQDFWTRWRTEYMSTLQQRTKWTKPSPHLAVGTLVLLKDLKNPPMLWPLGRVLQIFPGSDNITRVAKVKTANGVYTRPVVKLCPLLSA